MKNLALFRSESGPPTSLGSHLQPVTIDDVPLACGIVETPLPVFDPDAEASRGRVLLRVKAFSCNYRDKYFAYTMLSFRGGRYFVVGSEFAGEVVEVGRGVDGLRPGDRVLANNHYVGDGVREGHREGVASNQASKEYQVLHARKLLPIPAGMADEVAAAFSLNAQTAYSMVRRAAPRPGANVLVTSGRSNTALFLLAALKALPVNVYVSTTSGRFSTRLLEMGAKQVIALPGKGSAFGESHVPDAVAASVGGFDCVFDPMYDVHIAKAVRLLAPFGVYVSCGLVGQNPNSHRASGLRRPPGLMNVMETCMAKNLTLIGNCIGLDGDLKAALRDYEDGRFGIPVDSVVRGYQPAAFLDRTFNDPERFGKVVYSYA